MGRSGCASGERLGQASKLLQLRTALLAAGVAFFGNEEEFGVKLHGESAIRRRSELRE